MNPKKLFNQTITLYAESSRDRYGRITWGEGTDYYARVQPVTKNKLLPNGEVAVIDLIVYLESGVTVDVNYKILFDSVTYKVFSKSEAIDKKGDTNHVKLECQKWRAD